MIISGQSNKVIKGLFKKIQMVKSWYLLIISVFLEVTQLKQWTQCVLPLVEEFSKPQQ